MFVMQVMQHRKHLRKIITLNLILKKSVSFNRNLNMFWSLTFKNERNADCNEQIKQLSDFETD